MRNGKVLGRVTLEGADRSVEPILQGVAVVDNGKLLSLDDGQAYLDGLVRVLDGPGVWASHEQVTAAALNYDGPGGMVALYPLSEEAKKIARPNGEPWDSLHVTLFFFEDAGDLPDELEVQGLGELAGTISGIARFQEGEVGVPIVALPSVVGLNELRAYLTGQLSGYSERYGFIPHMTLGYDEVDDPEAAVGLPVTFTHVCVSTKDGRREFPLV
ncbi:MAG TPA: hypothetical protein VFX78_10260 [Candidatus Eisenbacteria bacterium]|nr:hypothetical protein [Candidatus Eisenbacteria bacterium]